MMDYNIDITEKEDTLEFVPKSDLTFEYARKMKNSLETTNMNNIVVDFNKSDFIDSTMVGVIVTAVRKHKTVTVRIREGSHIESVLQVYGFNNIINIEYLK